LAPFAPGFRRELALLGYRSGSGLLERMAELSVSMSSRGLETPDLTRDEFERFADVHTFAGSAGRQRWCRATGVLLGYLDRVADVAVLAQGDRSVPADPVSALVVHYEKFLVDERGQARRSCRNYTEVARSFLRFVSTGRELDLGALNAQLVIEFVTAESRRLKVASAKATTTRLRSFLRFLFIKGFTGVSLVGAVPSVAAWRLASLPKALTSAQVAALLSGCDRRRPIGRRDYAILVVLSRLGLRAGETARLALEDVDWRAGDLLVRGKGSRVDRLPLPVDVGEAVAGWLERGRPRCADRSLFVRMRPPQRELSPEGISMVVAHACDRAGLPRVGAHRLRHTAATEMLRGGASLAEVGHVMRQHSSEVTSIYAKVDRRALAAVVRPWPGVER
jgi:site-specific recombinase XerD